MLILSFARTTAALLAGEKTVTRREWEDKTFTMWTKRVGQDFKCYDKNPRNGGKLIAIATLTSVTKEPTREIPDSDWEAEGFAYMERHRINLEADLCVVDRWTTWREDPELITTVVRFDNVRPLDGFSAEMYWPEEGR